LSEGSVDQISWCGCWEKRTGRIICRWIVSWTVRGGITVGAIGGYSGGGAFQVEKFLEDDDHIKIEAFDDLYVGLDAQAVSALEDCLDHVLSFHEQDAWDNNETLYLRKDAEKSMRREGSLLLGCSDIMPTKFAPLFDTIGLITKPGDDQFDG